MNVTYRINIDDIQAAQWHYARTSRSMRVWYWRGLVFWLLIALGLDILVVAAMDWGWMFGAFIFVPFAVVWTMKWPDTYRDNLNRTVQKLLKENSNDAVLRCEHRMEIDGDGVKVASEIGQSRLSWTAIERVAETESHIFFTTGTLTVYVIPKWCFETRRQAEEFFDAAQNFHRRALI